jgi:hypothetical protein
LINGFNAPAVCEKSGEDSDFVVIAGVVAFTELSKSSNLINLIDG